MLGLFSFDTYKRMEATREVALDQARSYINKDQVLRTWATKQGGIYVPVSDEVQPNPYLTMVEERDIQTPSGKQLTLVNPAYLLRLVTNHQVKTYGLHGHLTSLNLLNPNNKPSTWERKALESFQNGQREYITFEEEGGEPYLHYMQAIEVKPGCLKCHGIQGYKVGDIRGGLSVNLPMQPFYADQTASLSVDAATHFLFWLIGLLGLHFGIERMHRLAAQAQSSALQLSEIANAVGEGVIVQDKAGSLIMANPMACEILGWSNEELQGQPVCELLHQTPLEANQCEFCQAALAGETKRVDNATFFTKEGNKLPVSFIATPLKSEGKTTGTVILFQDVTQRLRYEEGLEEARLRAEEASRAKSNFLSVMTHELRTPLNGILGVASFLKDLDVDEELRENLEIINESGKSLLQVINDIFDFSRIEAKRLEVELKPFDLEERMTELLQLFRPSARAKGLQLNLELPEPAIGSLLGDADLLVRVISNLLANAIKFTHQGEVNLEIERQLEDPAMLRLRFIVSDTGIGIAEKDYEQIFNYFSQVDASDSRSYGGTGLGLTIVKGLVELLGGSIGVESRLGEGSRFWVDLDFSRVIDSPVSEETPTKKQESKKPGLPILLVEDNPMNQKMMQKLFEKRGLNAEIAENGAIAVERVKEKEYSLIMMDLSMPVMDGFEAAIQIRELEEQGQISSRTPIVAVTALVSKESKDRCQRIGMDDFLPKPVRVEDMDAMLAKFL